VLFVIMIALFMVVGFVGGFLSVFLRSDLAMMLLFNQSISGVINIFAVPIVPVALVAIYQDLKLRAGGADLQARISSLRAT
jgi:maltodextrin utilization protein YvdJ